MLYHSVRGCLTSTGVRRRKEEGQKGRGQGVGGQGVVRQGEGRGEEGRELEGKGRVYIKPTYFYMNYDRHFECMSIIYQ